tara:strand:+ start:309 stop:752 length:444 start_codon:yes stop_codon:yes gene_type:complete
MEKLNIFLEKLASPFFNIAHWILRLGLGISFFLHGFGKLPISPGFVQWLGSKGVFAPQVFAPLIAWGEILAGLGIILGGILVSTNTLGNIITRISGGAVGVIMISAIFIAHSDWAIFIGERGQVLFASEQIFLLLLGLYFAIRGNEV